jgi:hypothetical protein
LITEPGRLRGRFTHLARRIVMHATHHLNDEHMQFYEWSGALKALPVYAKRSHPWHASYGVLALLTSLLIIDGCDRKGVAEQAGAQVDQAERNMKEEARKGAAEIIEQPGDNPQQR